MAIWVAVYACPVFGDVRLDVLTRCNDIASVNTALQHWSSGMSGCRSPSGRLERTLYQRVGGADAGLCFLSAAPADFLDSYSCVRTAHEGAVSLDCFRPAEIADVHAYQARFADSYAALANQYETAASRCDATNGNAVAAMPTTFSPLLSMIAKMEFGFTSPLGTGRMTKSYVQHGFASLDPSMDGVTIRAIEYVSFLVNGSIFKSNAHIRSVGSWQLEVDAGDSIVKAMNNAFVQHDLPVGVKGNWIALTNGSAQERTSDEKADVLRRLMKELVKRYEIEGFRDIPDDALRRATGRSRDDFARMPLEQGVPYGRRRMLTPDSVRNVHVMANTRRPACTEEDGGVVMAVALTMAPPPEVASDYGSVLVTIVGVGACSHLSRSSTSKYVDGLLDLAGDSVEAILGQETP